jgi:hypothetical protein
VLHRNPTLDPVLKSYELYLFDPESGSITSLQKRDEQLPILPSISPSGNALTYYAIIESSDFLITRNIEEGLSIQLRFDTGGYITGTALDFDNDRVITSNKRGENRQALYLISNRAGSIRRILNGARFQEMGFLANGAVYSTDLKDERLLLSVVQPWNLKRTTLSGAVEYVLAAPGGDALLYSEFGRLSLYRVNNQETIQLTESAAGPPLTAPDGSTCAVFEEDAILLINLPTGDVMYYLSTPADPDRSSLSDLSFYTVRGSTLYTIEHRKPGHTLTELHQVDGQLRLLGVSPNDRFVYFQQGDPPDLRSVTILDRRSGKTSVKSFSFEVRSILVPRLRETDGSFYIRSRSVSDDGIPVRELYYYDLSLGALLGLSTADQADLQLYYRE